MEKYYSITELADKYSISTETIRNWIYKTNRLKAIKIGGSIRIKESEIQKLIKEIN